jgi:hypothetical protein
MKKIPTISRLLIPTIFFVICLLDLKYRLIIITVYTCLMVISISINDYIFEVCLKYPSQPLKQYILMQIFFYEVIFLFLFHHWIWFFYSLVVYLPKSIIIKKLSILKTIFNKTT